MKLLKQHKQILQKSASYLNFLDEKKRDQIRAIRTLGFSNTGELREIKERKVEPLKVGVYQLVRQMLP